MLISPCGSLQHISVGGVVDVSIVHSAPIFTTEVSTVCGSTTRRRVEAGTLSGTIGTLERLKKKAIPVTGRGDPYVCETSRLPNFV
jgi:hypothetical protein